MSACSNKESFCSCVENPVLLSFRFVKNQINPLPTVEIHAKYKVSERSKLSQRRSTLQRQLRKYRMQILGPFNYKVKVSARKKSVRKSYYFHLDFSKGFLITNNVISTRVWPKFKPLGAEEKITMSFPVSRNEITILHEIVNMHFLIILD